MLITPVLTFGLLVAAALAALPAEAADLTKLQKGLEPYYRLQRPDGPGPFSAVMMVSGCSGFTPDIAPTSYTRVADRLKQQGFVVIFVDYLGARRLARCTDRGQVLVNHDEIGQEILASATYLRTLPFVKATDITVIGWSWGGAGVIEALREMKPGEPPVRAAVAYYPPCERSRPWKVAVPVLLLLGALDDVAPPGPCQALAKKLPAGTSVTVKLYPDARHGFDAEELPAQMARGSGTLGHNAAAAAAAWEEVQKLIKQP